MLAEKFLLLLETLRSLHDDGAPRVVGTSPHIAVDPGKAGSDRKRVRSRGDWWLVDHFASGLPERNAPRRDLKIFDKMNRCASVDNLLSTNES